MKAELFAKAIEKVPVVVAQMANWNTGKEYWMQKVVHYNKWGTNSVWSTETMDADEMKSMLRRADKKGYEITAADDGLSINVRRNLPDGEYFIVTYAPIVLANGKLVMEEC